MFWKRFFHARNTCAYSRLSPLRDEDLELTVVFRPGEDGYVVAECLQLPGCMSQGKTEREAQRNIIDAIQSCLKIRMQELLHGSCSVPADLVGIQSQETLRVKPPELETVSALVSA
jgi:predicted RNase H-like HicB family nuclease